MARDALGKLAESDELHKHAVRIKARDPSGARQLESLAQAKVRSAVKMLRTKPKRKQGSTRSSNGFGAGVAVPRPSTEVR